MGILMALLPSLGLLALGGMFGKRMGRATWRGVDMLNFQLFFPALMFSAAASRPIQLDDAAIIGFGAGPYLGLGCCLVGFYVRLVQPGFWTLQQAGKRHGGLTLLSLLLLSMHSTKTAHF